MPIAITAKYKYFTTLAATDHAVASFSHHTRSAAVQQVCCTGLTTVEWVIDFAIFDFGGLPLGQSSPKGRWPTIDLDLPSCKISARSCKWSTRYALPKFFHFFGLGAKSWAKVHQKGRWPHRLLDLPSYQISSHYVNLRRRLSITKIVQTKKTEKQTEKQTVADISPACLSACGDNNETKAWLKRLFHHRARKQIAFILQLLQHAWGCVEWHIKFQLTTETVS